MSLTLHANLPRRYNVRSCLPYVYSHICQTTVIVGELAKVLLESFNEKGTGGGRDPRGEGLEGGGGRGVEWW